MAKLKGVTVTTVHSLLTPLESIDDKSEWPDHIFRQASFAHSALNEDLKTGVAIIENFEKHRAWEYLSQTRENFFRHQVHVEPQKLELIRAGYALMHGECKTADQAIEAVLRRKGRPNKCDNVVTFSDTRGNDPAYLEARLKRDRPDLHKRVASKELSAHAAVVEAGWKDKPVPPTPLKRLRSAWKKASDEERQTFLSEITP